MASPDVVHLTDANFRSEVQDSATPVLVDFWAPWCGPCRAIAPTVDELAREYRGRVNVGKLNVDENPMTAGTYDIRSIPTLVLFVGGKIVDGLIGAATKGRIAEMLDRYARPAAV